MAGKPQDLTGQRFGSWTAQKIDHTDGRRTWWHVVCDCGVWSSVRADSLKGGGSKQCQACQSEALTRAVTHHGATKTPTWQTWHSMRMRCLSPGTSDYPRYGGRGIGICAKWDDYEAFLSDMGQRPSGMTLDRIDPNGNYEPENCRWATAKTQGRNRRRTVFLEANGERKSLSEWADQMGFAHITFYKRYAAGWTGEAIVNTPRQPPTAPKRERQRRRLKTPTGESS